MMFSHAVRPFVLALCLSERKDFAQAQGLKFHDSYEAILAGGEHGSAIIPGESASSRLVRTGSVRMRSPSAGCANRNLR